MNAEDDLMAAEWPDPTPPRRHARPRPPASDPALTAAEHYLRASGLVAAALDVGATGPRLDRLLGAATAHARLALIPDEIAAEARDLHAQARAAAGAADTPPEGGFP